MVCLYQGRLGQAGIVEQGGFGVAESGVEGWRRTAGSGAAVWRGVDGGAGGGEAVGGGVGGGEVELQLGGRWRGFWAALR